ncbi:MULTISPECIES: glutaredoxin family protein [Bacillus]|uniref:glutaredoxin family protein n=1 Tax=Bacillus TaxID=1386 RepID=UPI00035D768C|nr:MULTISPECIES: glutaredoxin family protein [Bacillus]MED1436927.1 glutaredoxin family protein [Bacillus mycoides]MED1473196.1 glutaredoxin family protein [Bacillus pseudomycoides]
MATKIIVYTKHNCPNCMHVKFGLEAAEVEYEARNIEEKEEYRKEFDTYGYSAAPVTVFPNGRVLAGFERKEFEDELGF